MIDHTKLQHVVRKRDGNIVAQCPACAEIGHDKKGEHLFVALDGKFGCIKHKDDPEHNQRIWSLAGTVATTSPAQRQISLRPFQRCEPKILMPIRRWTLEELAGNSQAETAITN